MTGLALDEGEATARIHGICLKTGPPARVGVELEWLVRDVTDPALYVPPERIAAAVAGFGGGATVPPQSAAHAQPAASSQSALTSQTAVLPPSAVPPQSALSVLPSSESPGILPSGAFLTTEPGGQLEISSQPADSLADCVSVTLADLDVLRAALAGHGLELAGLGLDPLRAPRRILRLPRYAAMEAYFDRAGPWGRRMMCSSASVQVCLDAGDDTDSPTGYRYRWRLLHAIGPVLVGAFANSPFREGKPTGWRSSRQQVWTGMDPGRTRPPRVNGDGDPRTGWAGYALDARLMCVRSPGADWSAPPGLTLRDWIRRGPGADGLRPPGADDLDYHLSTLFPPVRPRGHFELRMIDAQRGDGWIVPLAVATALLSDEQASTEALAAVERLWSGRFPDGNWPGDDWPSNHGVDGRDAASSGSGGGANGSGPGGSPWLTAARLGPADPEIALASCACFTAARAALDRMGAPAAITASVDAFIDSYVSRNRCPADDLLEEIA